VGGMVCPKRNKILSSPILNKFPQKRKTPYRITVEGFYIKGSRPRIVTFLV
jgi:hypothetical protein